MPAFRSKEGSIVRYIVKRVTPHDNGQKSFNPAERIGAIKISKKRWEGGDFESPILDA
jgi:hypothetical protein